MPAVSQAAKERNNQISLESYYHYKAHGICWHCKTRWVAPGRTYCEICTRQIKARNEQLDPGAVKRNAAGRERRAKLKAAGICVACGKRPAREGITRCSICNKKAAESRQAYNIRRKIEKELAHGKATERE